MEGVDVYTVGERHFLLKQAACQCARADSRDPRVVQVSVVYKGKTIATYAQGELVYKRARVRTPRKPLIEKVPGVCGGRAVFKRTRIPVWIVDYLQKEGHTEGFILSNYPSLTRRHLREAKLYSEQHPDEVKEDYE